MMIKVFISNREKQTFSNLQDEYIYLLTLFCLGFLRMARLGGEGGGGGRKVAATYNSKTIYENEIKFGGVVKDL